MNFATVMTNNSSLTTTENGAIAYTSAEQGALVDFFGTAGSMRKRDENDIIAKFAAAYAEDPALATKLLFYIGDIRNGGLGERRTFRICLKWLAQHHSAVVRYNIANIAFFNRFDSLFALCDTPVEMAMWHFINRTLIDDIKAYKASKESDRYVPVSLLAKWMPSEKASSAATRALAQRAIVALGLTPRMYRQMLSNLRKHIRVVERLMSANEWDKIDYSAVPSYAMLNYRNAFYKHDADRFGEYMNSVKKGEAKIHSGTLYPYNLVEKYLSPVWGNGIHYGCCYMASSADDVIEAQWKALPNYITKPINAVVMADVSGSMFGRPMATSIGLAIYFAQRNTGEYHNVYMTFSDKPNYIHLSEGASLYANIQQVVKTEVGYSTDLNAAFERILSDAIESGVSPKEMPKALVVISDMEINHFKSHSNWDFVHTWKSRFADVGYVLPKLVLWSVDARKDTFLTKDPDVIFMSGQSPASFANLCKTLDGRTTYELMCDILSAEVYNRVIVSQ